MTRGLYPVSQHGKVLLIPLCQPKAAGKTLLLLLLLLFLGGFGAFLSQHLLK